MKRRIAAITILVVLMLCGAVWARMSVVMVGGQGANAPAGCAGGSDGVLGTNAAIAADLDNGNASTPTMWWSSSFTPTSDGTISYCHYSTHYNETGTSRCVLMDTSGNVLDYSAAQAATGGSRTTVHAAMTNNYCLVTGTSYILAVWIDTDNYSGSACAGDWGTGHSYYKAGMTWNTTSFNLSSPSNADANRNMYGTVNNSASTP